MLGAIIGDIIGSIYEWNPIKTKKFKLFDKRKYFTDDTVLTCAVANALMNIEDYSEKEVKEALIDSFVSTCFCYRDAGFGGHFNLWLWSRDHAPYGSYGNGSAMRVSPVGWMFDSLEQTRKVARWTAEITHNHPEGIKGAEAVASVIFLARCGRNKEEIKRYVEKNFYVLDKTCDEIRPTYTFNETCQGTVPQAITAFLEGNSFEDVIRTAVSLGGDCDTLTCIAGSIAEAFYGVPSKIKKEVFLYTDNFIDETINRFYQKINIPIKEKKNFKFF